jgi:hypothetical protein
MTSVNVTLKSVVSYHENGSRYVPLYCAGMLSPEIPFKLLFGGFVGLDDEPEPEPEPLSFFFPTKIPTGIAIASMTTTAAIAIQIP